MFAYDKVYDRLFANEEFVDILCKFHTSNWEKLNKAERIAVLQEFVNKYVEILEIGDMKLKGDKRNKHYSGSYYDIGGLVNFNEEAVETTVVTQNMSGNDLRLYKIEKFFDKNDCITNADVRQMFDVSSATANRMLAKMVDEGKLQKIRLGKSWGYTLIK